MTRRLVRPVFTLILSLTPAVSAAEPDGWTDLLRAGPDGPFKKVDAKWIKASAVGLDPEKPNKLKATPADDGPIWVNGVDGSLPDLVTKKAYGNCEVHVEFLLGKNSNSGIKFHAVYEIQLRDTAKKGDALEGDDCGGIYPRAELTPKYHHIDKGIAPKVNAAGPAGEWQTLDVTFRSPRFGGDGKKTANAVVVKAVLNGKLIHENQELKTPTGHNWSKPETATGPFMLQTDHGPVAFRNVRIRDVKE